jgi:hypothetical protein
MDSPKTPEFSAYDFLGYIVPGLVSILIIDVSYQYHIAHAGLSYQYLCGRYSGFTWAGLIPLILLAYFIGHLISFVSSMTIERHALWRHGQPLNFIIYGHRLKYFDTSTSRSPIISKILRFCVAVFLIPIVILEIPFGGWMGLSENYIKRSDDLIRQAFGRSMARLLDAIGIDGKTMEGRNPWEFDLDKMAIHCALERAPAHVYTLRNYVVLYGFLRSMALILVVAFWGFWYHAFLHFSLYVSAIIFAAMSAVIFTCYAAFLKFWVRYSHEAIMAVIACGSDFRDSNKGKIPTK